MFVFAARADLRNVGRCEHDQMWIDLSAERNVCCCRIQYDLAISKDIDVVLDQLLRAGMTVTVIDAYPHKARLRFIHGKVDHAVVLLIRASCEKILPGLADEFVDAPVQLLAGLGAVFDGFAATAKLRAVLFAHGAERLLIRVCHCGEIPCVQIERGRGKSAKTAGMGEKAL